VFRDHRSRLDAVVERIGGADHTRRAGHGVLEAYRIVLTPPGTQQRTDKPLLLKVLRTGMTEKLDPPRDTRAPITIAEDAVRVSLRQGRTGRWVHHTRAR
jgi:hypothetical protein